MLMLNRNNAPNSISFSFISHIGLCACDHVGHTRCSLIIIVSNDLVNFWRCNNCTNTNGQSSAVRLCFEILAFAIPSWFVCSFFRLRANCGKKFERKNAKCLRCVMCFCLIILWLLYGCVDTSNTRSYGITTEKTKQKHLFLVYHLLRIAHTMSTLTNTHTYGTMYMPWNFANSFIAPNSHSEI